MFAIYRHHPGIALLVTSLLALLWGIAGYQALSSRQQAIVAKEVELERLVVAVEEQTLRLFKLTEASVITAARWIEDHPGVYPGDAPAFVELAANFKRLSDDAIELWAVDKQGGAHRIPARSRAPVANFSAREHFRVQLNPDTRGLFISDPVKSMVSGRWVVPVTYPVAAGSDFAMISAGIQLDRIVPPFEAQRMKPNGSITLIKMNGVTLLRAPGGEAYFGKSIAQAPDFIEHLSAKPRGMYRIIGAYDGVERLVGHARMKQYPVIVAVTATLDDALAGWWRAQIQTALVVLVVTLVTLVITFRLLAAERRARERLTLSERRFRKLIEHAPDAILLADAGMQRIIDANPRAEALFGRSREDLLSGGIERLYAPQQPDGLAADESVRIAQERALAGESVVVERMVQRPSGEQLIAEVRIDDISEDGRHLVRGSFVDITERKRAEQALRDNEAQLRALVDTSPLPMLVTTPPPEARVLMVNASFAASFGHDPADIPSLQALWAHSLPDASARHELLGRWNEALERMHAARRHSFEHPFPAEMHARDGARRAMEIHFSQHGERCLIVFNDLTAHHIHEEQLARIAHFDTLTGLPNRRLLNDRMERAIARSTRNGKMLAVCYLDLDNFKPVNDSHGHEAGDRVLVEAARRMEGPIRVEDTVARLGGDEFVLLLVDLETVTECRAVLRRIIAALASPFAIAEGIDANLSASIGVALFPVDGRDADELVRKADQAMYSAKQAGRSRVVFFTEPNDLAP